MRPRLIPCLLLKQGVIVRSQLFKVHQVIGNPMSTVQRFSNWNVDELVLLDISTDDEHDLRRDDLQQSYEGTNTLDVLRAISEVCFMPLAFGGGIRTLDDIGDRLAAGADKCVINTQALHDPSFVTAAAERFGSQCVVVSVDARCATAGGYEVFADHGSQATGWSPEAWAAEAERLGAGEIFLTSIDRDGSAMGYDLDLVRAVTGAVSIPVISSGGVGAYSDFAPGVTEGGASAVAAANIFHFFELSYPHAKQACIDSGLAMRPNLLGSRWFPREPVYNRPSEDARLERRLDRARTGEPLPARAHQVRWCTRCVYPAISAAPMEFDDEGVCMGCRMADVKASIPRSDWDHRLELLRKIFERARVRTDSPYDCVIPVSGGKDSWFQVHVVRNLLGLNPLLVTYNGNNWTPVGWRNMLRMREVFDVDHVLVSPSVETLKKLNRLGMTVMGDMNWHAHVGITSAPVSVAAQHGVSLVVWGEHGYLDLCGQFSMDDFPEMSYRDRLEHFARGYEWTYFVDREGLSPGDLSSWMYPKDQHLLDLDLRGIYLGNYVWWEANEHTELVVGTYGFEVSDEPFDRTYRRMSNLDDMHENGVHDYLKFVKFGYGRCTDHACKDIRAGLITREQGVELVRQYDHVKPSDLARWLDYVGWDEAHFDRIADTFRDPRVWRREGDKWKKINIWDEAR